MVTIALNSSKPPAEEKPHLPSGWQQKCLLSKQPLWFNHWSISKTHFFRINHLRPASPKRPIAETGSSKCPRSGYLCLWDAFSTFAYSCFPFNWQPKYQWSFNYYNCLLFIIIPPVTDVHVMLKQIECERRVWSTKRCQGKTERHLYLSIK